MDQKIKLVVEAYNNAKSTLDQLGKQIKGIGDEIAKTGSQSKSMLGGIKENWLAIGAAVGAVAVAVNKALDLMAKGAKAEQAEQSFRSVAAAAGESADGILAAMTRASNGTVDSSDIMQKAVKGLTQGLSGDQLVQIMEMARVQARRAGIDVKDAYEQIVDAIANNNTRALKQMGLVTKEQMKLYDANMAAGVRAVDLFALAQANATDHARQFGAVTEDNAEKLQKLGVFWTNFKEEVGIAIWDFIDNLKTAMEYLFRFEERTLGFVKNLLIIKGLLSKIVPGGEKPPQIEALPSHGPGSSSGRPPASGGAGTALEAQMRAALAVKAREAELAQQITNVDISEKTREISHLDAAQKRLDLTKELLGVQEKNLANIDKELNPQAWAAQQKAIDDTMKKATEFGLAVRELSGTFTEGIEEGFKRYLDTAKSTFQLGVQLAQETAQAMQQAFGDFFFDAIQGKLKSLGDYLMSFLQGVQRALANVLSQQATDSIIRYISGAFSGTTGNDPNGVETEYRHSGGMILHQGGYVPRFHAGGLSSDERPAILQTGEGVLSRKGMAALDALNSGEAGGGGGVTVNVINQSSQPVQAKVGPTQFDGKRMITSVILSDFEGYGPIRNAIAGLK